MKVRDMEAADMGSLDEMLSKVSVTVQEVVQELGSIIEPEAIDEAPQQVEGSVSTKEKNCH